MKNKKGTNQKKKFKKYWPLILTLAIIIILFIISYIFLGLNLSIIIFTGIGIIILIGHLLDTTRTKKKKHKIFKIILGIILTLGIIGCIAATAFIVYIVKNAPDFDKEMLKEKQSTVIYDSNGVEFAKLGTEIRENIEYNDLSEVLVDAIVATEDSRFFQHNGFDLMRFLKATIGQLAGNRDAGGGSTLSMQVVKNTFTDAKADSGVKGIIRKFTDIYISIFQLEKNYTKEEIIEFYTNNHSLGDSVYGVQAASQYYFNKNARDLNLAEASLIAGLYKAPNYYNPYKNPKTATKRRNTVLYLMERHGYITNEERKLASSIPIKSLLSYESSKGMNPFQGYIDTVVSEINERYGVNPYKTPMLIYTNMVRGKQNAINWIMNNDKYSWWKDDKTQGAVVVLNSNSGKLEAIGTGRHRTTKNSYNYATKYTGFKRQIGSTAKPLFDYGPGMEYNNWSTYTLFDDERGYTYSNGVPINNYDGRWEGVITLRRALYNSRNIPALKAFQQVDNRKIIDFVTQVGITPEISNGYIHEAHSIGAFTGSDPLTMAAAYQMFSNGGYYYEPYAVNKVVFRTSGEKYQYSSAKEKVISDSTAFMITSVLKDAVEYHQKKGLYNDIIAVKTGTTNLDKETLEKKGLTDYVRDYWVVGYTPDTIISLWMGYDEYSNVKKFKYSTDYNLRSYFFNAVARNCLNHNKKDFPMPKSVVRSAVEKLSDPPKLPSPNTPKNQILYEYFKRGTEPTEISNKYMKLSAPTNLTVTLHKDKVTLNWNASTNMNYLPDKEFGYYIYFNNVLQAFTTDTNYTIDNLSSYYGTYSVKTGYKDSTECLSNPANYTLEKEKEYNLTIDKKYTTLKIGDNIDKSLYDGSLINLKEDGIDITNKAQIVISIKDKDNVDYKTIPNDKNGTYQVTYTVTYKKFTKAISNTIYIKD